nr:MBG domain-containing protein [Olsenella intestinalis]
MTASLVVAGLHTDAIADVLGLSATSEPEQVTETTQPAANDAATADVTGAAASGASEELASAERETEETGRAAAEEAAREADEAAAREAEQAAAAAEAQPAEAASPAQPAEQPAQSQAPAQADPAAEAEARARAEAEAKAKAEEQARRDAFELAPEGVDEGIAAGKDFSSQRLLIAGVSREQLTPATRVLSEHAGMFLTQFDTADKARNAYLFYKGKLGAALVEPDTTISAAEGAGSSDAVAPGQMSESDNPLAELNAELPGAAPSGNYTVALVDTGYAGAGVVDSAAVLGTSAADDNGHGTAMAERILEAHPGARIVSIKALGADGRGTVSSVYAAIEYARAAGADVINLSLSAWRRADNEVVADAIDEAVREGSIVVGAAGNSGTDASYTIPGGVASALVMGACDDSGARIASSNFGATVDAYGKATSTSQAAAAMTGWLSANQVGPDWQERVAAAIADGTFSDGGAFAKPEQPAEPAPEAADNGFHAAASLVDGGYYFICPYNGGGKLYPITYDASTATQIVSGSTGVKVWIDSRNFETDGWSDGWFFQLKKASNGDWSIFIPQAPTYVVGVGAAAREQYLKCYSYNNSTLGRQTWEIDEGTGDNAGRYILRLHDRWRVMWSLTGSSGTISSSNTALYTWGESYTYDNTPFNQWSMFKFVRVVQKVKFASGGGSGTMTDQTFNVGEATAIKANTFTKKGYSFSKWSDGSKTYTDGQTITNPNGNREHNASKTFTAQWTANDYAFTLDPDADNVTQTQTGLYYRYDTNKYYSDAAHTKEISKVAVPTRTGYTFGGYYTEKDGGGTQYVASDGSVTNSPYNSVAENKTLYAKWTLNTYTVAYNLDGGTHGATHPTSATYDSEFTVSNPTKRGNGFAGWNVTGMDSISHFYGDSTTTATSIASTKATTFKNLRATSGTVTFKALWNLNTPTITLDSQSATTAGTSAVYFKWSENAYYSDASRTTQIASIQEPTRTGYSFEGYYTEPNGGGTRYIDENGAFVNDLYSAVTGDTTLYAKWTTNTFTVDDIAEQTYTGAAVTPALTVRGTADGQTSVIALNSDYTATFVDNVAAGTATVTVNGKGNFAFADPVIKTFRIAKADGLKVTKTEYSGTYDGAAHASTVAVAPTTPDAGTIYYATVELDDSNYRTAGSTTAPSFTDAGTHTTYFYIDGVNYRPATGTLTTTIDTRPVTVVGATGIERVYDGTTAVGVDASLASLEASSGSRGLLPSDAASVSLAGSATGVAASKDAGTRAVTVSGFSLAGERAANYTIEQPGDVTVQITQRSLSFTWPSTNSFTYDRAQKSFNVTGVETGVAGESFAVTGYESAGVTTAAATDVGAYTSRVASIAAGANTSADNYAWEDAATRSAAWSITKADASALPVSARDASATYNAAAHQLPAVTVDEGYANDAVVTYSYTDDAGAAQVATADYKGTLLSGAWPAFAAAGEHVVTYTVSSANYADATGSAKVTVTKAPLSVAGATAVTKQYDGGGDVTLEGGELSGVMAADAGRVTLVAPTAATIDGSTFDAADAPYPVTPAAPYAIAGDAAANYELAQPTLSVTVKPRTVSLAWSTADSFTYDGAEKSYAAPSVGNTVGSDSLEAVFEAGTNVATDAGTYTARVASLTATGSAKVGNYTFNASDASHAWYIGTGTLTLTVEPIALTYGDAVPAKGDAAVVLKAASGLAPKDTLESAVSSWEFECTYTQGAPVDTYRARVKNAVSANYQIAYQDADVTVAKRPVTFEWAASDFSYDGTPKAYTGASVAASSVYGSDDVTVGGYQGNVATEAGSYTATVTSLAGAKASNYQIGEASGASHAWEIAKVANTWVAAPAIAGWTYGKAASAPTATPRFGGPVTFEYKRASDPDSAYATTVPTEAGDYVMRASVAGSEDYAPLASTTNFSIAKARITVTGDNQSTAREEALVSNLTYTVSGDFVAADADALRALVRVDTDANKDHAGVYDITPAYAGAAAANYDVTFAKGAYTVRRNDVTVSAEGFSGDYDAQPHAIAVTTKKASDGTLVTAGHIYYTTNADGFGADVDAKVQALRTTRDEDYPSAVAAIEAALAGRAGVTQESPAFTNQSSNTVRFLVVSSDTTPDVFAGSRQVDIARKPLTVTATDKTITYGDAPANAGVTSTALAGAETLQGLGEMTFSYNYAQYQDVAGGSFQIVPAIASPAAAADNYDITYVPGTLTVARRTVDVTWPAQAEYPFTGAPQTVTATLGNVVNADDVTVGSYADNVGTAQAAHTASVAALAGAKAANYQLPASTAFAWAITAATNRVTSVSIEGWTYGESPKAPSCTADFGASSATFSYYTKAGESFVPVSGTPRDAGTYYVAASIAATADYGAAGTATADYAEFQIAKRPITVTADTKGSMYGEPTAAITHTLSGGTVAAGDDLGVTIQITDSRGQGVSSLTSTSPADAYALTPTVANANYDATCVPGTYTISKTPMAVEATGWEGAYDGSAHTVSVLPAIPTQATVTYSITSAADARDHGQSAPPAFTDAGTYTVYYHVASDNYAPSPQSGELTVRIDKVALTATARSASITYGEAPTDPGIAYDGFVNGETVAVFGESAPANAIAYEQYGNVGTFDITPSGPAETTNYVVTYAKGALTVARRPVTLAWSQSAFAYDEAEHSVSAAVQKAREADDVSVSAYDGTTAATASGAYSATATAISGASAGNYELSATTNATQVWTISRSANEWVTQPAVEGWTYDGTSHAAPQAASRFTAGGEVTFQYKAAGAPDSALSSEPPTQAGDYVMRATAPGSGSYDTLSTDVPFTVAKQPLTVKADEKSSDYLSAPAELTYTVEGLQNSDELGVDLAVTDAAGQPTAILASSPAGAYTVTPSVTNAAALNNYDVTCVAGTYTVVAPTVGASAHGYEVTYDAAPHGIEVALDRVLGAGEATTYYSTVPLTAASLSDNTVPKTTNPADPSVTQTEAGSKTVYWYVDAANYTITPVSGEATVTVQRRALRVTAHDVAITYGEAPAGTGVTYEGFAPGESETSGALLGTIAYSFDYAQGQDVADGAFHVTPLGVYGANYDVTFVPGTLSVSRRVAQLSWSGGPFTYNGAPQSVAAVVANAYPGDDVVPGGYAQAVATDAGSYRAAATSLSGAKADNYDMRGATGTEYDWQILQAPNAIGAVGVAGWTFDGTSHASPSATATWGQSTMAFEYAQNPAGPYAGEPPVAAGTYYVRAQVAETNNWAAATSAPAELVIAKAPVTVTARDYSREYEEGLSHDGLFSEASLGTPSAYDVAGLVPGDELEVTLDLAYPPAEVDSTRGYPVGSYAITPSWVDNPNYAVEGRAGTLRITPSGAMDVVAEGYSAAYDGRPHTITATPTKAGVTMYYAAFELNASNYLTGSTNPLDPQIMRTEAGTTRVYYYAHSDNYDDVAGSKEVNVTRAPLTVTANNKTITYGEEPAHAGVTYAGLVATETPESLGLNPTVTVGYAQGGDAGTYAITPSGLVLSNYDVTYASGTLTVDRRPATFAWEGDSFVYDATTHEATARVANAFGTDDVTCSSYEGNAAIGAGSYTARVTALGGAKAKNYLLDPDEPTASHAWEVTQAPNAASVAIAGWTYGRRDATANAPRATATWGAATATFQYRAADAGEGAWSDAVPTQAGSYLVRATVPETTDYAGATSEPATFQVARAPITISASDASRRYDPAATHDSLHALLRDPDVQGSYVAGDDLGLGLDLAPGDADGTYPYGTYAVTPTWNSNPNYDATIVAATLSITKTDITISSRGYAGTYDARPHSIAVTTSLGPAETSQARVYYATRLFSEIIEGYDTLVAGVNNPDPDVSNANLLTLKALLSDAQHDGKVFSAAPECVNAGVQDVHFLIVSRNYNPDAIVGTRTIRIDKAPLAGTLADARVTYGDATPAAVDVSYAGFKGSDTAASVSAPTFSFGGYAPGADAGTYTVTATPVASLNYEPTYTTSTLTVARRAVQLAWDATEGAAGFAFTYDGAAHGVDAAVANRFGDDDVTVASYQSNRATSAGAYTARALSLGGTKAANYAIDPAADGAATTQAWQIDVADNRLTAGRDAGEGTFAPAIAGWTYGDIPSAPSAQALFGQGWLAYEYKPADAADDAWTTAVPSAAGDYLVRAHVPATSDYRELVSATTPFTIARRPVTVVADDKSSGYGMQTAPLTFSVTSGSVVAGDEESLAFTPTCDVTPTSMVSTYPIDLGYTANANYDVTAEAGTYTVSRANLNVAAADTTATYDAAPHGISVQVAETLTPDEVTVWYSTAPLDPATYASVPVKGEEQPGQAYRTTDPLDPSVSQTSAGEKSVNYLVETANYTPTPMVGTKVTRVERAPLTVTALDASVTFGDAPADDGATYEGFVEGEGTASGPEPGVLDGTLAFAHAYQRYGNVGDYAITPSGLTSANYDITYVPGTLSVQPRQIQDAWLTLDPDSLVHTGAMLKPGIALTMPADAGTGDAADARDWDLVEGRDFELSGTSASAEFGTHEFTLAGTGNFAGELSRSWRVTGKRTEVGRGAIGDGEGVLETDVLVDGITIEVEGLTVELLRSLLTPEELAEVEAGATGVLYLQVQRVDKLAAEDEDPTVAKFEELGATPALRLDVTLWKQVGSHAATQITDTGGPEVTITFDVPEDIVTAPAGFERSFWGVRAHEGEAKVLCGPSTDLKVVMGSNLFSGFTVGYRDEELPSGQGDGTLPAGPLEVIAARLAPTGDATPTLAVLAVALAGAGALAYGRRRRRDR